jgi:hypothetical protein
MVSKTVFVRPFTWLLPLWIAAVVLVSRTLFAGDVLPRDPSRTITLDDFNGQTFLQAMQASNGIYAKTLTDSTASVTIVSPDAINAAATEFDPKVGKTLYGTFKNGESDFTSIVGQIQSKSLSPQEIFSKLTPLITNLKYADDAKYAVQRCGDIALLASSSGTLVQIDPDHYFYNIAYLTSEAGRSYGVASTTRALLDQSDSGFLTELNTYLEDASASETSSFFTALLRVLTQCDSTNAGNLPDSTQVVTTDFITIYTAELIRHNKVNLDVSTDPWEIDLAEVTLLTDYGAKAGMVMQGGKLVTGTASDYGTSSIGDTRSDFTKLAKFITTYETTHHPNLVNAIMTLTPISDPTISLAVDGDVFRRVMVYLNRSEFQDSVKSNAGPLTSAVIALLKQVRKDSSKITTYIQSQP